MIIMPFRARRRAARLLHLAVGALSLALLAACNSSDTVGPSNSNNNNGSNNGNNTVTGTLKLINSAPPPSVFYLHVKACGTLLWGTDRLGTSVMQQGQSVSLNLAPGCYAVRFRSSNGDNLEKAWMNIQVQANQTTEFALESW